jgi:hypothetical protein
MDFFYKNNSLIVQSLQKKELVFTPESKNVQIDDFSVSNA